MWHVSKVRSDDMREPSLVVRSVFRHSAWSSGTTRYRPDESANVGCIQYRDTVVLSVLCGCYVFFEGLGEVANPGHRPCGAFYALLADFLLCS